MKNETEVMSRDEAAEILRDVCRWFPGLRDGETDVNGGDLVNYLAECIAGRAVRASDEVEDLDDCEHGFIRRSCRKCEVKS